MNNTDWLIKIMDDFQLRQAHFCGDDPGECWYNDYAQKCVKKIIDRIDSGITQARIEEAALFNRYFDDNLAYKGFAEQRLAELTKDTK